MVGDDRFLEHLVGTFFASIVLNNGFAAFGPFVEPELLRHIRAQIVAQWFLPRRPQHML